MLQAVCSILHRLAQVHRYMVVTLRPADVPTQLSTLVLPQCAGSKPTLDEGSMLMDRTREKRGDPSGNYFHHERLSRLLHPTRETSDVLTICRPWTPAPLASGCLCDHCPCKVRAQPHERWRRAANYNSATEHRGTHRRYYLDRR